MIVVAFDHPVRLPAALLKGFLGRLSRDRAIAAGADQILSAGLDERLPHDKPVFGFEELHQCALQLAVA
jgi:hypothetical protein